VLDHRLPADALADNTLMSDEHTGGMDIPLQRQISLGPEG
jgi:hypothetical protein